MVHQGASTFWKPYISQGRQVLRRGEPEFTAGSGRCLAQLLPSAIKILAVAVEYDCHLSTGQQLPSFCQLEPTQAGDFPRAGFELS